MAGHVSASSDLLRVGQIQAGLVSEYQTIAPGESFTVALALIPDEHWHLYWSNPGDAGLPPSVDWILPEGFSAGAIQWPYPERITVPPLTSFGYHEALILPVTITAPNDIAPGTTIDIRAKASWLVCKEDCYPGKAELSLHLPVTTASPRSSTPWQEAIEQSRKKIPRDNREWNIAATVTKDSLFIRIEAPPHVSDLPDSLLFFPHEKGIIDNNAAQTMTANQRHLSLTIPRDINGHLDSGFLSGILVAPAGWPGSDGVRAIAFEVPVTQDSEMAASTGAHSLKSLWTALIFAFLGGMILNLMPCVLPVLSLKILGFVNQASTGKGKALHHGLVFALGVLVSFWILAAVLFILRAGGAQLGWGFQLQSPGFIVILASFMFLFGLNLLGVFEMGTSLTSVGGHGRSGLTGAFLNGVTATIVATPCTAPFMGSALGFALIQPWWIIALIFTALALGMAAPYVVLSAMPSLLRFVPKPGAWMETLKHIMGFLLMATVIWLAWVLGIQAGSNALVFLLGTLLIIAIGAWVMGRWAILSVTTSRRRMAYIIASICIIGGLVMGLGGVTASAITPAHAAAADGAIAWEPFASDRIREVRAEGNPVFIDFTAAWCLSCQVNERVAFSSEQVQQRFTDLGIKPFKADWTSYDEDITRALAQFGRNSVPLYIYYPAGADAPIILPEILTPGVVLDAVVQ